MTLCPVALAIGCRKCPIFGACPLKRVIGDYKPESAEPPKAAASAKPAPKGKKAPARKAKSKR